MNKIKSLSLAVLALVLSVSFALAAKEPNDAAGNAALPENAGWMHKRQSATAEMLVCEGKCILGAIILNTGATSSEVRVRNTSVGNGTGVLVLQHRFQIVNTSPGNNPIAKPILLDKGITTSLTSVSAGEEITVLYRDLD